jgi:hypothetical protein
MALFRATNFILIRFLLIILYCILPWQTTVIPTRMCNQYLLILSRVGGYA